MPLLFLFAVFLILLIRSLADVHMVGEHLAEIFQKSSELCKYLSHIAPPFQCFVFCF